MKQLVQDIIGCAQMPGQWERVLHDTAEELGLFATVLFKIHDFQSMRGDFYWSERIRLSLPDDIKSLVESGQDTEDHEAFARLMQLPALTPHSELSLMGVTHREDLPPSKIRVSVQELGVEARIGTILNRSGPWADCLITHTKAGEDHLRFTRNPKVHMLMPLFSGAITLGRVLDALRARYSAALSALDHLGLGVFILDTGGRVADRNAEAQTILDQRDGLSISATGQIRLHDPQAQLDLQNVLHQQFEPQENTNPTSAGILAAPRQSGVFDYLISARALRDVEGELEHDFRGTFLTVIDPARRDVLSADGLTTLGELTAAEGQITQLLVNGLKIADISDRQDVSVETVRSHVKSVLQKLRCGSQSDVIRTAASTRLPFIGTGKSES